MEFVLMSLAVACSAAFLTPISTPGNMMGDGTGRLLLRRLLAVRPAVPRPLLPRRGVPRPGHLVALAVASAPDRRRMRFGAPSLAASARYRSVLRVAASSDRVNSDEMSTLLSIEPFEVSEHREASRVRVSLRGELDLATAG